jgi:transglutaminase-like putative cysteine protease
MSPFVPSLPLGHFLAPTALTEPDRVISAAAFQLSLSSSSHLDFAEQACAWAKAALAYGFGATGVRTTASDALAGGLGVCQDYAHIMLALCRAGSVPARYVSGHLMGEGGSHAWVEALVPRAEVGSAWAGADAAWGPTWEAEQGPPVAPNGPPMVAVAFDPTHNRRADHGYLTVAVGRDYGDVAPTSGTFDGPGPGALSVAKSLKFVVFEPVPTQLCFGQLGSLVSSAIAP